MPFHLVKKSIVWDITLKGKRFRIFTGLTTDHWLDSEQRVSKVEDFSWEKNELLEKLERETQRLKIKLKVEGLIPSKVFLQAFVDQLAGLKIKPEPKEELIFVWQIIGDYRERMKNSKEKGHLKNFKSLQDHFKENYPLFRFSEMSEDWVIHWVDRLVEKELILHNTIVRKVRELRAVGEYARRTGHAVHLEFNTFRIKERKYHPFYLDWATQVKKLQEVELTETLDRIRDRFLFRCYTGIREGEMDQMNPAHFIPKGDKVYLKYMDIKGKKPKTIQLSDQALILARKYDFDLPKVAQQTENLLIKQVAKLAKLTGSIDKIRHSGNRVEVNKILVADMISTHTARRTFARRWYEQGGDLLKLSKYLGHSSISVTERYVGVEDDEANDEMMRVMNQS